MVNVEAVVVTALRAANLRAYVDVPAVVVYPVGRVTRIGGGVSNPQWIDRALLQVEFWGSSGANGADEAFDAARDAVAALGALVGAVAGGYVTFVRIESIANAFDDTFTPSRARRIITAAVTTHP